MGGGAGPLVTTNAFAISYDVGAGQPSAPTQHVYSRTFASLAAGPQIPADPTPPPGGTFTGWFTAPTGGTLVTDSTDLMTALGGPGPRAVTLSAHYDMPPTPPAPPAPPAPRSGTTSPTGSPATSPTATTTDPSIAAPPSADQPALSVRLIGLPSTIQRGGRPRTVRCTAIGPAATCTVRRTTRTNRRSGLIVTTVSYTATATDAAGAHAVTHGSYKILGIYLKRRPYTHGRFEVRRGGSYALVVTGVRQHPRVTTGASARRWRKTGRTTWTTTVTLPQTGRSRTAALRVRSGASTHRVPVRFV
jgi:hypothetical protein